MKKILVIVDMQNDFVSGSLGSSDAVQVSHRIGNFLNEMDPETLVIFTQDTHYDDYLKTQEGQNLPVPHCMRGTEGWQIVDILAKPFNGCPLSIEKGSFGTFQLSSTIEDLADGEDFEVFFCGVCTDICVVSNAIILKAAFPEAKISVYEDMCAGTTPENHRAAIDTMRSCQINIIKREG